MDDRRLHRTNTAFSEIMINGDLKSFFEYMSSGCCVIFLYRGNKYFTEGWIDEAENAQFLCLRGWELDPKNAATLIPEMNDDYFWMHWADTMEGNVEAFKTAPIFHGKTVMEVEDEIEWVDD